MEDNNKIKFKAVPFEALIKVEISGTFMSRLQELLFYFMQQKPVDEVTKIIEYIKENEPKDEYSFHLVTLLILIQDLEKIAAEQNLIKDFEVDKNTSNEN